MAQPQGLNVPAIITTGVVTVLLVATVVEGVRAYYNYTVHHEEERKWTKGAIPLHQQIKDEQLQAMHRSPMTMDAAMKAVVDNKGKLPATQPAK